MINISGKYPATYLKFAENRKEAYGSGVVAVSAARRVVHVHVSEVDLIHVRVWEHRVGELAARVHVAKQLSSEVSSDFAEGGKFFASGAYDVCEGVGAHLAGVKGLDDRWNVLRDPLCKQLAFKVTNTKYT
jgi:hypothetical protein